jgi:hypothetical protein
VDARETERFDNLRSAQVNRTLTAMESLASAELELEDRGWLAFSAEGQALITRTGLMRIIEVSRAAFLMNPLVKQAILLATRYVFGQGVSVKGRDARVNQVIQDFWSRNARVFTSHKRLAAADRTLSTDGNVFIVYATSKVFGKVTVRKIPIDQITEIITDPDDRDTPQFYRRSYLASVSMGRSVNTTPKEFLYPDLSYSPTVRLPSLGDVPIQWDTPVQHIRDGGLDSMLYGVPEPNAGLRWALSYTAHLDDWAAVVRSLRVFTWEAKTQAGASPTALKNRLQSSLTRGALRESNPAPAAGSMFASGEGLSLKPFQTAGANISPEDSKMVRHMVAANFGTSDPHISMDVQQGALATADNLNQPMALKYRERQELWKGELTIMHNYVLAQAAMAETGPLAGLGAEDPNGDTQTIVIAETVDTTVDVTFPPIVEHDLGDMVRAVISAITLDGKEINESIIDATLARKLILSVFSERGIRFDDDELNDTVTAVVMEATRRIIKTPPEAKSST